MRVNTDIWGAESTWRRDADGFSSSSTVPDDMQFKRGEYDNINNYVTNGRLEQGEPIDYSICYAGMAEGLPLTSIRTWSAYYNRGWCTASYKHSEENVGWFFGHMQGGADTSTIELVGCHTIFKIKEQTGVGDTDLPYIQSRYWTPDGTVQNYPNQPSQRMIPIVSFPTRGCYFDIHCLVFNPDSNTMQTKYLSELQTGDWSGWQIIRVWGELWTYGGHDRNFISVVDDSSNQCLVCANKPLKFKPISGALTEDCLPVLNYAQYIRNNILIFGWATNEYSNHRINGTRHIVFRSFDNDNTNSSNAPLFIDTVPNAIFNIYTDDPNWVIAFEGYCEVNAENLEAIRKAAASYGLFFTEKDGSTLASNADRWVSNDMFCGSLDNQGIGRGEYTYGINNRNNSVYNMDSSQDSKYDPDGKRNLNIYIGDSRVSDIYIGDKFVNSVYLGDCQL